MPFLLSNGRLIRSIYLYRIDVLINSIRYLMGYPPCSLISIYRINTLINSVCYYGILCETFPIFWIPDVLFPLFLYCHVLNPTSSSVSCFVLSLVQAIGDWVEDNNIFPCSLIWFDNCFEFFFFFFTDDKIIIYELHMIILS